MDILLFISLIAGIIAVAVDPANGIYWSFLLVVIALLVARTQRKPKKINAITKNVPLVVRKVAEPDSDGIPSVRTEIGLPKVFTNCFSCKTSREILGVKLINRSSGYGRRRHGYVSARGKCVVCGSPLSTILEIDKLTPAELAKSEIDTRENQELEKKEEEEKKKAEAKRIAQEERAKERAVDRLFEDSRELVDKFFKIAERKVSIIDEYGDENWEVLSEEINVVVRKIAIKNGDNYESLKPKKTSFGHGWRTPDIEEKYDMYVSLAKLLEVRFREFHGSIQRNQFPVETDLNELSGKEFETYVGKLLKSKGYVVAGTSGGGDQGADLIAEKDGKRIIIQAKRYVGNVGNAAVQEVVAAVKYYAGDEGWVVTNSTFTPAARALAQKNNVHLVNGSELQSIG